MLRLKSWEIHFSVASRGYGVEGLDNHLSALPDAGPTGGCQDDNGDAVGTKILLVSQIRICCHERGEAVGLCSAKQLTVLKPRPSTLVRSNDLVMRQ